MRKPCLSSKPLSILLLLALVLSAHAALPPLSPEQRVELAELVVTGRISRLHDDGQEQLKRPSDGQLLAVIQNYRAVIEVATVEKGQAGQGDTLEVAFYQRVEGPPGPQGQNDLPAAGQMVRVFAVKDRSGRLALLQPNGWESLETPAVDTN